MTDFLLSYVFDDQQWFEFLLNKFKMCICPLCETVIEDDDETETLTDREGYRSDTVHRECYHNLADAVSEQETLNWLRYNI